MRFLNIVIFISCLSLTYNLQAQTKQYKLEQHQGAEMIHFTLSSTSGSWRVLSDPGGSAPVNIFCNLQNKELQPEFEHEMIEQTCYARLSVSEPNSFGKRFSQKILGMSSDSQDNQWDVKLAHQLPFMMNLNYGMGDAAINLSQLPVKRFKIKTASANVNLSYEEQQANLIEMDTFQVEVELGTVNIQKLNLARARQIIADVGMGSLTLDFTDVLMNPSDVSATVGAGNINIILPESEIPVIVHIVNSPLCRVKFEKGFTEIRENVFVNKSYDPFAKNALTFKVDVAMGMIEFTSN